MNEPPRCEFEERRHTLKIDHVMAADVGQLEEVASRITRQIGEAGCSEDLESVELVLREAIANAILHGSKGSPFQAVRICVALPAEGGIDIVVKDTGPGFDPSQVADPLAESNLLANHGRGLFLIRQLMDEVRFRFGTGTEIHMRRSGRAVR